MPISCVFLKEIEYTQLWRRHLERSILTSRLASVFGSGCQRAPVKIDWQENDSLCWLTSSELVRLFLHFTVSRVWKVLRIVFYLFIAKSTWNFWKFWKRANRRKPHYDCSHIEQTSKASVGPWRGLELAFTFKYTTTTLRLRLRARLRLWSDACSLTP